MLTQKVISKVKPKGAMTDISIPRMDSAIEPISENSDSYYSESSNGSSSYSSYDSREGEIVKSL